VYRLGVLKDEGKWRGVSRYWQKAWGEIGWFVLIFVVEMGASQGAGG
jgi:hypothetical protein